MVIRQEVKDDHIAVHNLIKRAFENEVLSDHTEHQLVERLRNRAEFIPQLSLVACIENEIIGYILLTPIHIESDNSILITLALAPVAVNPLFQGQGIGSALINAAHNEARLLNHTSIALLGHAEYYPRFGYRKASDFDITFPFDVPDENCMMLELIPGALAGISGKISYPIEFYS